MTGIIRTFEAAIEWALDRGWMGEDIEARVVARFAETLTDAELAAVAAVAQCRGEIEFRSLEGL